MTTINSNVDKIRNKLYQRRSPSRSIAAAMAQTEGAASALPPFYRRPAVLAAARHFGLSYVPIGDYRFARASNSIPLTMAEFVPAVRHYPIVFTLASPVMPVAIVGFDADD